MSDVEEKSAAFRKINVLKTQVIKKWAITPYLSDSNRMLFRGQMVDLRVPHSNHILLTDFMDPVAPVRHFLGVDLFITFSCQHSFYKYPNFLAFQ